MNNPKYISISIKRSPADVYNYASNPENLPKWASGLSGSSVVKSGNFWICDSPMGQVKVRFADRNPFGVMDHDVTLSTGEAFHNPFRVIPNGDGSEVVFTLFKLSQMSDAEFEKDAATIAKDLSALKKILES